MAHGKETGAKITHLLIPWGAKTLNEASMASL